MALYVFICPIYVSIYLSVYLSIYLSIQRHVFRPSQDSSVWLGLTSREQLMSSECSKHQVLSFAKCKYIYICIYIRMYIHVWFMYIYVIYMWIYIHTKNQTFILQVRSSPSVRSCRQMFNLNLNESYKMF